MKLLTRERVVPIISARDRSYVPYYRIHADQECGRPIQVPLANTPRSPSETNELRNLAQVYTTMAETEEWIAVHVDKTVRHKKRDEAGAGIAEVQEPIL